MFWLSHATVPNLITILLEYEPKPKMQQRIACIVLIRERSEKIKITFVTLLNCYVLLTLIKPKYSNSFCVYSHWDEIVIVNSIRVIVECIWIWTKRPAQIVDLIQNTATKGEKEKAHKKHMHHNSHAWLSMKFQKNMPGLPQFVRICVLEFPPKHFPIFCIWRKKSKKEFETCV